MLIWALGFGDACDSGLDASLYTLPSISTFSVATKCYSSVAQLEIKMYIWDYTESTSSRDWGVAKATEYGDMFVSATRMT